MPLSFDATNWSDIRVVAIANSYNPVFILGSQGTPAAAPDLVLKFAPGVERIRFANTVFDRMNMGAGRTRYIARGSAEETAIFAALRPACVGKPLAERVDTAWNKKELGILLMEFNPAQKFEDVIGTANMAEIFANMMLVLQQPTIRRDMARLIAADMLLGNFDRIAFRHSETGVGYDAKMHGGNFFYTQLGGVAHLLPLDNDTVAPTTQHLSGMATQEDLYRAVIQGVALQSPVDSSGQNIFPESNQASMDWLLGPQAADSIATIIADFFFKAYNVPAARDKATYLPIAQQIVPEVRAALQEILGYRKDHPGPDGAIQGLNTIMQAYRNIEGMNYDVFKVRCRFAELMFAAANGGPVNQGATDESTQRAVAYGKYRDWKKEYLKCFAPPTFYRIPAAPPPENLGFKQKAERKGAAVRSFFGIGTSPEMVALAALRSEAHAAKSLARKSSIFEDDLKRAWDRIKDLPETDRAIVKAKILVIADLIRFDLENRCETFHEICSLAESHDWVANYYCKFIRKRLIELNWTINVFRGQVAAIQTGLGRMGETGRVADSLTAAHVRFTGLTARLVAVAAAAH